MQGQDGHVLVSSAPCPCPSCCSVATGGLALLSSSGSAALGQPGCKSGPTSRSRPGSASRSSERKRRLKWDQPWRGASAEGTSRRAGSSSQLMAFGGWGFPSNLHSWVRVIMGQSELKPNTTETPLLSPFHLTGNSPSPKNPKGALCSVHETDTSPRAWGL